MLSDVFIKPISINTNYIELSEKSKDTNQEQTNDAFSEKWNKVEKIDSKNKLFEFQYDWYLNLYGFDSEQDLATYLQTKKIILDAGCGLGYKAAWFAKLAPQSIVIGMDFSESVKIAAANYKHIKNLYFIRNDIANTGIRKNTIDYISCDQVIMHTEHPDQTFRHLSQLLKPNGEFGCYVYAKKALPRELIDDYFRKETHQISNADLWEMSGQLTELGKRLSELKIEFESPDIPLLGIKGGKYDIQRFIYWNFLKCFWKEEWEKDLCDSTNFDWYSPSNAKRYSEKEFKQMISDNQLSTSFFHSEEACYSGRFKK